MRILVLDADFLASLGSVSASGATLHFGNPDEAVERIGEAIGYGAFRPRLREVAGGMIVGHTFRPRAQTLLHAALVSADRLPT